MHQLHSQRELLISGDQRMGLFTQQRLSLGHALQDHHFVTENPVRVGKPSCRATDILPSGDHAFGQGKALLRAHEAGCGGAAEARQH